MPSMHSIVVVFPAPFGPDQPEDLAIVDFERDFVHGDRCAVGFADAGDLNYWARGRWGGHDEWLLDLRNRVRVYITDVDWASIAA